MNKYYLAYGSNLNTRQMRYRCPDARVVGTAIIKDYRLLFKGSQSGSYLTIEPCKGSSVPVAVWSVTTADELSLDRYEGYPNFYYKADMKICVKKKKLNAFVYIMHEERPLGLPTSSYYRICLDGYNYFGFDTATLEKAYTDSKESAI